MPALDAVAAEGAAHPDDGGAAPLLDLPGLQVGDAEEAPALGALAGGRPAAVGFAAQALAVAPGYGLLVGEVSFQVRLLPLAEGAVTDLLAVRQTGAVSFAEAVTAVLTESDARPAAGAEKVTESAARDHPTPPILLQAPMGRKQAPAGAANAHFSIFPLM